MVSRESRSEEDPGMVIRREMRSKENARFLRSMPSFRLDEALPARLASLMDDLRQAESGPRAGNNRCATAAPASMPRRTWTGGSPRSTKTA